MMMCNGITRSGRPCKRRCYDHRYCKDHRCERRQCDGRVFDCIGMFDKIPTDVLKSEILPRLNAKDMAKLGACSKALNGEIIDELRDATSLRSQMWYVMIRDLNILWESCQALKDHMYFTYIVVSYVFPWCRINICWSNMLKGRLVLEFVRSGDTLKLNVSKMYMDGIDMTVANKFMNEVLEEKFFRKLDKSRELSMFTIGQGRVDWKINDKISDVDAEMIKMLKYPDAIFMGKLMYQNYIQLW